MFLLFLVIVVPVVVVVVVVIGKGKYNYHFKMTYLNILIHGIQFNSKNKFFSLNESD